MNSLQNQIKQSKYIIALIILFFSVFSHFIFFGHPKQVVFDEVHFGGFVQGYFTHEYYFDIHPPLGKLMIGGVGWIFQYNPAENYEKIGNQYADDFYMALRLLPIITGTILPLIIYGLCRELKLSKMASFFAAMLIILENALLVQSRFILLDAFLILFGFLAFYCYMKYVNTKLFGYIIGAFVLCSLAISIKWTGLSFL